MGQIPRSTEPTISSSLVCIDVMSDLAEVLERNGITAKFFADDVELYLCRYQDCIFVENNSGYEIYMGR